MEQAARAIGSVAPLEAARSRGAAGPIHLALEVSDPEVLAELRHHLDGDERDRYALAALRVGVLALRTASGQVDAASVREAGNALVGEVRELLSARVAEFSLDDEQSAMSRLSKMLSATSEQIGKNLTLDDEGSALFRLKRELSFTIDRLVRDNVEFQSQVREALARLDTRRKDDARTPQHGVEFEERLGALLAGEAQRLGDLYEATGDTTGQIKNCKVGDHVVELGLESAAAHARVVWEAKDRSGYSLRAALEEICEARRNRQAQVGVFIFSKRTAPEGLEPLQRHGTDILVAWDAEDPAADLVVRAAYSLARALAVRERRSDRQSQAALAEIERAARGIEKQIGYLEDVRKWAETVKGHGDKILDRSGRMAEELRRDVERLDAHVAAMRKTQPSP